MELHKYKVFIHLTSQDESVITKAIFTVWLGDPQFIDLLEEIEVEVSTKYELFDALDVDGGGELSVDELVSGLMKLRGLVAYSSIC